MCNGTINNTDRLGLSWIEKLKKCNKMLEDSKSAEPFAGIRLLHIEMVLSGCDPVMPVCTCCLDSDSAFYWPFPPSIFICSNNFSEFTDPLALASILYQEWVHQYQNCKGGPSVMNCSERICAEIEAQYAQYKAMYPSMYGGASDLAMKNAIRNGVKATSVGIFTCSEAEFDKLYNQLFDSCKRKNKIPLPGDTNQ